MRSKLFVPGSRPELFDKALASQADALSIDLEDAVLESRKAEARALVGQWLRQLPAGAQRPRIIVRVNAMDTPHFAQDLEAVVQPGLDVVNLPKPANAEAVREACAQIERLEQARGLSRALQVLLNIETPQALADAAALARAHPRVMGLQVGLGDLFEPLGIDRREVAAVQQVLFTVRMAAAQAGVDAFDGAFANVRDTEGFLAESALARRLGLAGKSCIHPSQVALANQAFRPTDAEVAHAFKVLEAAEAARAQGLGAYMVDGRMIDAPFERRAQAIADIARRLGLQPPQS